MSYLMRQFAHGVSRERPHVIFEVHVYVLGFSIRVDVLTFLKVART